MTLDLLHADAVDGRRRRRAGHHRAAAAASCTRCSPTASRAARTRGHRPAQLRQARDRPPRVRQGLPPVRHRAAAGAGRPRDDAGRRRTTSREPIDDEHDRDHRLGLQLRLRHDRPDRGARPSSRSSAASACTSTAASAASSCRSARSSATTSRCSTSACPASRRSRPTPTSTATGFKGTSTLLFRDKALRNGQYFFLTDWSGGKYCSPGIEGSRSGGLLAATWAVDGLHRPRGLPRATPSEIFETVGSRCRTRCARTPSCGMHGRADVLLQLHLRRVRHLPRQRLHEAAGLALQRPAVPERDPHGGDPARRPSPAWSRRSPTTSPRRSPTPASTGDEPAESSAVYGGVAGRPHRRRRRVHPRRDDRDDGFAAGRSRYAASPRRKPRRNPFDGEAVHRSIRAGRRPGQRGAQGRGGLADRRDRSRSPSATTRPSGCRAAEPSRTPRPGGEWSASWPVGR